MEVAELVVGSAHGAAWRLIRQRLERHFKPVQRQLHAHNAHNNYTYVHTQSSAADPYLTFGVDRLLHLPSAEAVSVRPNAQPRCNQKVTVIGCEAETSAVKPNKSPAT